MNDAIAKIYLFCHFGCYCKNKGSFPFCTCYILSSFPLFCHYLPQKGYNNSYISTGLWVTIHLNRSRDHFNMPFVAAMPAVIMDLCKSAACDIILYRYQPSSMSERVPLAL
jgi:hypothetical protein